MRRYYTGNDLSRVQSVAEMAVLARSRVPYFVWEYLAGGAENEITLDANRSVFDRFALESRTLQPNHPPQVSRNLLGVDAKLPFGIAPTGYNGMLYPQADIELAKAAAQKGIPFTLSTVSNAAIEEVRAAVPDLNFWFQLYPMRDPEMQAGLLERARNAGVSTLFLTSDAAVLGNREWDRRNFPKPRRLNLRNKLDVLRHPGWVSRVMFPSGLPVMGNLVPYLPEGERNALGSMKFIANQMDPLLDWEKLARLRDQWTGKLILKGVLHPDDAEKAVALGLDGIVVTNHGGRQLDGALSSLEALERVSARVSGKLTILMDSGIRRGTDIIKALALGADGVLLGRATLYGVTAKGSEGAGRVIDLLSEELQRALNLMGCTGIDQLDSGWLVPRKKEGE